MTTLDNHRYNMLVCVREFGAAYRDRFPAAGRASRLFAAISKAVEQLGTHTIAESAGERAARDGTLSKVAAREALRQALEAIARTARALDTRAQRLGGKFRLPSVRNDHELTTAARSFGRDAAGFKAQFLAHGLPKTFIADLRASVDAFERASQARFVARASRGTARAGIRTAIDSALIALNRLDAIVLNTFRDEEAVLVAWTRAKHITRARTRGRRQQTPSLASPAAGRMPAGPKTPADPASLTTADAGASA